MTYPAEFTPYAWEDLPAESTPVDKAELNNAEKRLAKFTEEYHGLHWRNPVKKVSELNSLYKPKGENVKIGDVAFVFEIEELYLYGAKEEWVPITSAHWKPPVEKASELPAAEEGDIRYAKDTERLYVFQGSWKPLSAFMPPVTKASELPVEAHNLDGDIRYAKDKEREYVWSSSGKVWSPTTSWRPSVAKKAELPAEVHNIEGDLCYDEETERIYVWHAGPKEWKLYKQVVEATIVTQDSLFIEKVKSGQKADAAFVRVGASEKIFVSELEGKLGKGKAKFKFLVNGSAQKFTVGGEEPEVTESATAFKLETPVEVKSKDELKVEITSETGTPEFLTLSAFAEHKVKVETS